LTDGTATSAQLEWMRLANEEFFVVEEWGKDRRVLGCEDADGIVAVDERALRVGLASRRVPGVSTKPHTFWLNHPARRQYRRVAYDPEWKTLDRDKDLNLWRGFAVEPKAGDWSLLRTHILDNIAGGNEEIYRHVIGLLADIVQHPGTPSGVALVLQGEEGVGKGMLANAMLKLFGRHGYRSSNPKSLSGEFSGHRESLSLFYADEMSWAGDKTLREQLWGLITEALQEIHPKHRTPYMAPNFLHFILTTNKEHAATIHTGNRRIFLLEVRDQWDHLYGEEKKAARDAYFARLYHQLYEEGGLEAMLHDLLLHDLSGFNVRVFPTTAAMTHNVALSMTSLDRWLLMLLRDGWEDGKQEDKALLYRRYTEAARDMGDKYPAHDVTFWKRLRKVLGGLREERSRGNERKRMVILPALNTARKHAARVLGVPINADE
jgi:hypothetical protein